MRGTLHLVAAGDVHWLLRLMGNHFISRDRRRRLELGFDEDTCARGIAAAKKILAERGPLTRDELAQHLSTSGIRLEGQARRHLLYRAALEGSVCNGPVRGKEPTYVLLDDWIDPGVTLSPEEARAELARRYLNAYAPARPEDLARWSGLPVTTVRAGWKRISKELVEVAVGDQPAWMPESHADRLYPKIQPPTLVRLLPAFDTYLLGYHGRDLAVAPEQARKVLPGGGMLRPTLIINGEVVGIWRPKRRRNGLEVIVDAFDHRAIEVQSEIDAEVAEMARFLGVNASLSLTAPE